MKTLTSLLLCLASCTSSDFEALSDVSLNSTSFYQISNDYAFRKAIEISRDSQVKILTSNSDGSIGMGTGTYIRYKDHFYIVTADHVINTAIMSVAQCDGEFFILTHFFSIPEKDFAILRVDKIKEKPYVDITKGKIDYSIDIGETLLYTGYPNAFGPLTIFGKISGLLRNNVFIFNSYAWPGASGSAIFNKKGDIVGILVGVEVLTTGVMQPQLNSNIILMHKFPKNIRELIDNAPNHK